MQTSKQTNKHTNKQTNQTSKRTKKHKQTNQSKKLGEAAAARDRGAEGGATTLRGLLAPLAVVAPRGEAEILEIKERPGKGKGEAVAGTAAVWP